MQYRRGLGESQLRPRRRNTCSRRQCIRTCEQLLVVKHLPGYASSDGCPSTHRGCRSITPADWRAAHQATSSGKSSPEVKLRRHRRAFRQLRCRQTVAEGLPERVDPRQPPGASSTWHHSTPLRQEPFDEPVTGSRKKGVHVPNLPGEVESFEIMQRKN